MADCRGWLLSFVGNCHAAMAYTGFFDGKVEPDYGQLGSGTFRIHVRWDGEVRQMPEGDSQRGTPAAG